MDVVRQKLNQARELLLQRYENNSDQPVIDGIRFLLFLGFISSCFHGTWVDYLTIVIALFKSVRAVDTPGTRDDTFWVKYWLIFSLVKIFFDHLFPFLKSFWLFPFIRLGFLYYCGSYTYQGADVVYAALSPYLLTGANTMENFLSNLFAAEPPRRD